MRTVPEILSALRAKLSLGDRCEELLRTLGYLLAGIKNISMAICK